MYLEKKFHKYSVVIFDLLINNRFLKNQECVFINFDLWQNRDFFVMATTPYLRRWTETKQNKNKLKIKKTKQINKQLDYMKTIYNFKINDTVTKWTKKYFTWLQHLTIAQTPAWRYIYNFSHDKK